MDANFWHRKWGTNDIAFHENAANPLMVEYFKNLSLTKGSRIFLPLCGKSLDIHWLLSQGYRVAGAELSQVAIDQLFTELELEPKISNLGKLMHYSTPNIDIFVGDIFELSGELLGKVDAIYDRAALVALPEEIRQQYTTHLTEISGKASQLLICFEYDQSLLEGPPFSISDEEIRQHYHADYDLYLMTRADVAGGLKGKCAARENVWLLKNH